MTPLHRWSLIALLPLLLLGLLPGADKTPLVLSSTTGQPELLTATDTLRVRSTGGIATIQAATQDGIKLLGRAGGTGSHLVTITPTTLTGSRTYTGPDASGTLHVRTLTGTANEITVTNGDGLSAAPTFSLPAALTFTGKTITGGTYTGATITAPTLTVRDNAFTVTDESDTTKTLVVSLGSMATGNDLTLSAGAQNADRTLSFPVLSGNDTLAALGVAQTFTAANTFTAQVKLTKSGLGTASPLWIENTAPAFALSDSNQAADTKITELFYSAGEFQIRGLNDAETQGGYFLRATRGSDQNWSQFEIRTGTTNQLTLTTTAMTVASTIATSTFASTTASTSSASGAVVITGGLGVGGNVNQPIGRTYSIGDFTFTSTAAGSNQLTTSTAAGSNGNLVLTSVSGTSVILQGGGSTGFTLSSTAATFASGRVVTVSDTTTSASVLLSGGVQMATGKNFRTGTADIATNATDGFIYVSTCAGTPTGTPTTLTGTAPIVIDRTNNKLYFYSGGAWRDAGP